MGGAPVTGRKEERHGRLLLHSYLLRAASSPAPTGIPISKHRDEKGEIKAKIKRKANENKKCSLTIAVAPLG